MKRHILFLIMSCSLLTCKAQFDMEKVDSAAVDSRIKADHVLELFKDVKSPKLLCGLSNKYYYILTQEEEIYMEFYVETDEQGGIVKKLPLVCSKKRNAEISKLNPFDFSKYHWGFVKRVANVKYESGLLSYFVVKDKNGDRYGEVSFLAMTLPFPFDSDLYLYISKRLAEL